MGSLTAVVDVAGEYVTVDVTGIPTGYLTLYRTPEGGREQAVGGAQSVDVSTAFSVKDYEAPQRIYLSYRGEVVDGDGTVIDTIPDTQCSGRIAHAGDWLFPTSSPIDGRVVIVESQLEREIEVVADVAKVINRSDPVVLLDANQWWSGKLSLLTTTLDDEAWLENILLAGQVIGFCPYEPVYGYRETQFFVVTKVGVARFVRRATEQVRRWRLEVQTVERPA